MHHSLTGSLASDEYDEVIAVTCEAVSPVFQFLAQVIKKDIREQQ